MGNPGLKPAPQLRHALVVEGRHVELLLRRSARRSIALQVDERGVRVSAPLRTSLVQVEQFVQQHGRWLIDRLQARAERVQAAVFIPEDGACLPLFGQTLILRLRPVRSIRWVCGEQGEELVLPEGERTASALRRALQARALDWHRQRVAALCGRLDLPAPAVRLTSARTRWGSCSSRSGIRLHWRLIHLPPTLIDYVVAHEVAHLVEMNHSPRFWAVVEALYPDWRAARRQLRAAGQTLPLIADASGKV